MTNFESFLWGISSIINLLFPKRDTSMCSFLSIEQIVTYLDGLDKGEQEDPDGDTTSE